MATMIDVMLLCSIRLCYPPLVILKLLKYHSIRNQVKTVFLWKKSSIFCDGLDRQASFRRIRSFWS